MDVVDGGGKSTAPSRGRAFTFGKFGADIAEKVFGIRKVNPNDVVLKPSLLGLEVKIKEWALKDESGK